MIFIKYIIYIFILAICTYIGFLISKKYLYRFQELNEFKTALNTLKTKIRFTNENLKDLFLELATTYYGNVATFFQSVATNLNTYDATTSWNLALNESPLSLKSSDKEALKSMGKMLGKTDLDGQLSEIEVTEIFLETQIVDAKKEKDKNEKMYRTLGIVTGIGIVIILV